MSRESKAEKASGAMSDAVQAANFLKQNADDLRARGPTVDILFEGEGAIGIHIVNISCTLNGRLFDRVVVASTAPGCQAENRVFFGDQVIQVNETKTGTMKMKEVKLLIADAERPIKLVLQPLCIYPSRRDNFPMCPPQPSSGMLSTTSPALWGVMSRSYALVDVGAPQKKFPSEPVEYLIYFDRVFVSKLQLDGSGILLGDVIVECNASLAKRSCLR